MYVTSYKSTSELSQKKPRGFEERDVERGKVTRSTESEGSEGRGRVETLL